MTTTALAVRNLATVFRRLGGSVPLTVGTVSSSAGGLSQVTLPNGQIVTVRGTATPGDTAFMRSGAIESTLSGTLPVVVLEV